MSQLLYIQASPRKDRSHSSKAADAFVAAYSKLHPEDQLRTLNLFDRELPAFDGPALEAKYAILHGRKPGSGQLAAWRPVEALIEEFKAADKYALAVPMWNFHLPYRLKHYLDILVQPTYTFSFSPAAGYQGLVTGKPVFVAYARGGEYPPGSATETYDFQTRYLEHILGFIGLTDIRRVVVEPTLGDPEVTAERAAAAAAEARKLAENF